MDSTRWNAIDVDRLVGRYYDEAPDPEVADQRVAFGTSGHRGSADRRSFNEAHIHATTQAICRYRAQQGIDGPLFVGRDPHALSAPAFRSAVEVLVANGVDVRVDEADLFTPTPVVSHAILTYNRDHPDRQADGIVVTPSHNPPEDGGFKYNPPHAGPADATVTGWIQDEANRRLAAMSEVERIPWERARHDVRPHAYLASYLHDLPRVVDLDVIRGAGLSLGADPLGVRRSITGVRSVSGSGWTSRWSTTGSIPPSRSCRLTTTAASGWTAPRRRRWQTS
jgi:alpha-D-glucose phosphate-specific phosphoglucomutase